MQKKILITLIFFHTVCCAQTSMFYKVHKITFDLNENNDTNMFLKQWDTLFYDVKVSPFYKGNFINQWAFYMTTDSFVNRTKFITKTHGYQPMHSYPQLSKAYDRIMLLDSVYNISLFNQLDNLHVVWENSLSDKQRSINTRLKKLWTTEYFYIQGTFRNDTNYSHVTREIRDSVLRTLWEEYLNICETQGFVPNSFDNNWDDQAHYMRVFWHLYIFDKSKNYRDSWNKNVKYFLSAFKAGKISSEFCYFYDLGLQYLFGTQYYGTLKDVPIRGYRIS